MFDRILVPLDGSKLAEQVLPHVTTLAKVFNTEVIMLEICETEESQYKHMCEIYMDSQAARLKSDLGESTITKVKKVVMVGKPTQKIAGYAQRNEISLIVMASHGRSGLKPLPLGTTVDNVLHKVHIPLIVVRVTDTSENANKVKLFSRVLTPLDGSEEDEAALPYVKELIKRLKSEVILLQVVAPGQHVHTVGGLDYVRFDEHEIESIRQRAQKYLHTVKTRLTGAGAMVRYEVRVGDPAQEIVKCADETNCSLIAISTHARTGIDRWIHGSTAQKVIQSSNNSLLLVPLTSPDK